MAPVALDDAVHDRAVRDVVVNDSGVSAPPSTRVAPLVVAISPP